MSERNPILLPYLERPQIKQHTQEWYQKRDYLVTASKAAGILECSQYGPPISRSELAEQSDSASELDLSNNVATAFGIHHEDIARKAIEERLDIIKIHELGLAIHKVHKWLGASPDGIFLLSVGTARNLGLSIEEDIPCLVEIKCPYSRQINYKVPFEYWIQMQMQMEVWDVNYVLYSENEYSREFGTSDNPSAPLGNPSAPLGNPSGNGHELQTGILIKSWEVLIERDRSWFNKILPILQQNKQRLTKEKRLFWNNSWNPNQIRNWITGDPILDWLDRYQVLDPILYQKDPVKKYDLARFASKQTKLFHQEILNYLDKTNIRVMNVAQTWYDRVRPSGPSDIEVAEPNIYKSYAKYAMTLRAIQEKVPVIADGILVNETTRRWGKADLLVREDYLSQLFQELPEGIEGTGGTEGLDEGGGAGEDAKDEAEDEAEEDRRSSKGKRKRSHSKEPDKPSSKKRSKQGSKPTPPTLPTPATQQYRYYVVLTRFASLRLTADGIHLLNEPKQKLYKSYISFLTDCLPEEIRASSGFIIGRKAAWTQRGETYKREGFSQSLGQVSLRERDSHVPTLVEQSVAWLTRLKEEGSNWRPEGRLFYPNETATAATSATPTTPTTPATSATSAPRMPKVLEPIRPIELCPNMKNKNDHPWHNAKKRIAKETKEITEILNIGPEKRNNMILDGIERWDQIKEEDLETYKISDKTCVGNILRANQEGVLLGFSDVKEALASVGSAEEWEIECYVDFETVTDLNESIGSELFDTSPGIGGQSNIIYMIGCYVKNNRTKKDEYLNYLIKTIDPENEKQILTDWMNDLTKIMSEAKMSKRRSHMIPIYHWSPAEVVQLRRVKTAYGSPLSEFIDRMNFIDLYQIFKEAKVGIPGAFGYGLKTVAKALHKLGKIADTWEENLNGADAMVAAWYLNGADLDREIIKNIKKVEEFTAELVTEKSEQPSNLDKLAKEIIIYNYYDCKVMEEIVDYARQL